MPNLGMERKAVSFQNIVVPNYKMPRFLALDLETN